MIVRRLLSLSLLVGLAVAAAVVVRPDGASAAAATPAASAGVLNLQTVPPLRGVVVTVDGATARSDERGRIVVLVRDFVGLESRLMVVPTRIAPDREVVFDRFRGQLSRGGRGEVVELGVRTRRLVSWRFMDRFGDLVPATRIASMRLRSNTGEVFELSGPQVGAPLWVPESRTQQGPNGLVSKRLYYVVDNAIIDGTSVVNKAQQRFVPWDQASWTIQILFFQVAFTGTDLFFGSQAGSGIELIGPTGMVVRLPFGPGGSVTLPDLPRGTYDVKVYGGGLSFARPVSISKDQTVTLSVITWLNLVLAGLALASAAIGLVALGRPTVRTSVRRAAVRAARDGHSRWRGLPAGRRAAAIFVVVVVTVAGLFPAKSADALPPGADGLSSQADPVPVLAYYYIWFTPTSWNRGKIDYPLLGRYSSDDVEIMRRHVRMAKAAGIDGFLVSWKHTPLLDERLAKLVGVARAEDFRLGIVYQGLDFQRDPLPLATIKSDLNLFADQYATDPAFDIFGKPIVVWTGSNRQTRAEIGATVAAVRDRLLVLGNAKSVQEIQAIGPAMEGQAYYWSSVDPFQPATQTKLAAMARAVHLLGGVWVAPAAPGFDARLVGGKREVLRRDGETLRASMAAARASEPDAIGLISWNEFSENTHIEPSERYGTTDINALAAMLGATTQITVPRDSSEALTEQSGLNSWQALMLASGLIGLLSALAAWRRRRSRTDDPGNTGYDEVSARAPR